jgi:TolA-binding protein
MSPLRTSSLIRLFALVGALLLSNALTAQAQPAAQPVATLVYFEGTVRVGAGSDTWSTASIDQPLRPNQTLQTGGQARAELEWVDGETTVLGPDQTQTVAALFRARKKKASGETQSMLQRFTELFSDESSDTEAEAGGVRRSKAASAAGGGGLHWKRYEAVSFEEAATPYRDGSYAEAAPKLHLFLQQSPDHPKAALARFALGHCYVSLNNPMQAREAFEVLMASHPSDPLADRARKILEQY